MAGRLCTFRTRGRAVGHVAGRVCTFRTRGGAVGPVAERRAGGACTPDGISGGGDGFSFIPHLSLLSSLLKPLNPYTDPYSLPLKPKPLTLKS